jgi:hypothetical protein
MPIVGARGAQRGAMRGRRHLGERDSSMNRAATWILIAGAVGLACGCGGGGKSLAVAAVRAKDEAPSVEVCLDRLEDIRILEMQLDDFVFRTPVGPGAPWVERIKAIPADRAAAIGLEARSRPPYDLPGSSVSASKVYVLYNEQVLAEAAAYAGQHMSFMDGLAALGVPEAGKIRNKYDGVKANQIDIAGTKGTIEGLEAELELDDTPERKKQAIPGQLEALEQQLEALEERNRTAEEALYAEVEAMKARGPVAPDAQPLAAALFYVAQHAARMEEETMVTSRLAMIQIGRAMPNLPQELQSMATRILGSVVQELGQNADAARSAQLSVSLAGGQLAISVSGLAKVDPGAVQQSLMRRLTIIRDQVTAAPTTAAKNGAMAEFEHAFFKSLAEALGVLSGNVYTPAAELPLPGVSAAAPPPAGGFGAPPAGGAPAAAGGYGAPAPAGGGFGTPPASGGYGAPAPAGGGFGTPPASGGYGAPAPAGGGFGTPPASGGYGAPASAGGGFGTPPAGGAVPPPPAGGIVPPSAAGGAVPPPPASNQCPAALCGGKITGNGIGPVALKTAMAGIGTALGRTLAPKTDATHAQPTENVNGISLTFCQDRLCRIEVTVNPPATAEGFGVGSKFSLLAKKYGQSKCVPIDAKRFGVEFEKLPGVFWISDKLNCEGIEDIDFWDRPLPGSVTLVVIGMPGK